MAELGYMGVALLTASVAILVWMCLQVAYLAHQGKRAADAETATGSAGNTRPAPLAVADQAPTTS